MGPRRIYMPLAAVALAAAAMALLVACGEEEEVHVNEGEPLALGDLSYNVAITRFLNPDDAEDAAYLEGQPEPKPGEQYLGVFMVVDNEGDQAEQLPSSFEVEDTTHAAYDAVESDNDYALPLGGEIAADDQLPEPDTAAANGPIKGAMVLFLVPDSATENRPLDMKVPSSDGDGTVELDI